MLQTMPWPGNIRQLRNVIERVLILGEGGGPIEARELPGLEPTGQGGGVAATAWSWAARWRRCPCARRASCSSANTC